MSLLFLEFEHNLKEKHFEKLATITKGKSGADIHTIKKILERKRWSQLSTATHFTKKSVNGKNLLISDLEILPSPFLSNSKNSFLMALNSSEVNCIAICYKN